MLLARDEGNGSTSTVGMQSNQQFDVASHSRFESRVMEAGIRSRSGLGSSLVLGAAGQKQVPNRQSFELDQIANLLVLSHCSQAWSPCVSDPFDIADKSSTCDHSTFAMGTGCRRHRRMIVWDIERVL